MSKNVAKPNDTMPKNIIADDNILPSNFLEYINMKMPRPIKIMPDNNDVTLNFFSMKSICVFLMLFVMIFKI
jgi:hypothetical protein